MEERYLLLSLTIASRVFLSTLIYDNLTHRDKFSISGTFLYEISTIALVLLDRI